MPNYNITIDSKFDPYSFEDYLKPLAILQEQHNQAADAYANYLAQSAGMEEALAANPNDIDLLNQYNTYRQTLNNLADDLSKNGISRATRRGAFQAKADYGNIAKMQEAIKTRDELLRERRGLRIQDPSLIFSNEDSDYSIKNVMAGKTNYDALSLKQVENRMQDALKNWADSAYIQAMNGDNPELAAAYGQIFYELQEGATPEQIANAREQKDPSDPVAKELRKMMDSVVNEYMGAAQEYDENGNRVSVWRDRTKDLYGAAGRGLNAALGTFKFDHFQDLSDRYATAKSGNTERFVGAGYDVVRGVRGTGVDLWGRDKAVKEVATEIANLFKDKNLEEFTINDIRNLTKSLPTKVVNPNDWNFDNFIEADDNGLDLNKDQKKFLKDVWSVLMPTSALKSDSAYGLDEASTKLQHLIKLLNGEETISTKGNNWAFEHRFGNNKSVSSDEFRTKAKEVTDQLGDIIDRYVHWANGDIVATDMIQFSDVNDDILESYTNKNNVSNNGDNIRSFKGQDQKGNIIKGETISYDVYKDLLDRSKKDKTEVSRAMSIVSDKDGNPSIVVTFVDKDKNKTYHMLMPELTGSNSPFKALADNKDAFDYIRDEEGNPILFDEEGNQTFDTTKGKPKSYRLTMFQDWMKNQREFRNMMNDHKTSRLINEYQENVMNGRKNDKEHTDAYLKYIKVYQRLNGYALDFPVRFLDYFRVQKATTENRNINRGDNDTSKNG